MSPPPLSLPLHLQELLRRRDAGLLPRVEAFLRTAPRECIYVESERVGRAPLARGLLGRLLRLPTAAPTLSVLASKWGGTPYVEEDNLAWSGFSFLGQINFSEIGAIAAGAPARGIVGVDLAHQLNSSLRVRWYPAPDEQRARPSAVRSVGKWEARMRFEAGWSLPGGAAWDAPLPPDDTELREAWNDWCPDGFNVDERRECHRLFGHKSAGLDEHYGFVPVAGRSDDIAEYEMVWRITFDNEADFAWGTNWLYVILHKSDLATSSFERAIAAGANY